MANKDAAFGLRPVQYRNGSPYNGASIKMYAADTTNNLFVGDAVSMTGTGSTDGFPAVERTNVTKAMYGVIVGIESDTNGDLTRDTLRYVASNTNAYISVCPAQDMIFVAQEDSGAGNLAVTDIGSVADMIYGTASTTHPILSAGEIDSSTAVAATTALFNVRIHGLYQEEDNAIGANARWLVTAFSLDELEV